MIFHQVLMSFLLLWNLILFVSDIIFLEKPIFRNACWLQHISMYCTYQVTVFECRVNHMFLYWSQAQFCLHTCWMFGVKLHFQTFVWIGNWKDQTFSLKDHYQGQLSLDFHAIAFLVRKKDLEMVFRVQTQR